MKEVSVVVVTLSLALLVRCVATTGCVSELINGDTYRVSDQMFFASNSSASEPPHQAREDSGRAWCTEPLAVSASPWLEVLFGVEVELRELGTAGWASSILLLHIPNEYIRSYQVQYARAGEELQYVTNPGSTVPKIFSRNADTSLQRVQLPAPITADRVRIDVVPSSWTGNRSCLIVEAYGCPINLACPNSLILSNNRTFLPLEAITASSQTNHDPPQYVVDTSDKEWCSAEGLQSGPYIQLNFTEPVVLTHMRARGGDGGLSYVTAFSILSEKGAGLEQYKQPNGVTARFAAVDHRATVYTFWNPLTVNRTVRFRILGAVYNNLPFSDRDFCWNVELFGCLLSQDNTASTTAVSSTTISSSHTVFPMTSSAVPMIPSPASAIISYTNDGPSISLIPMMSLPASNAFTTSSATVAIAAMLGFLLLVAVITLLVVMVSALVWRSKKRKQNMQEAYFTIKNDLSGKESTTEDVQLQPKSAFAGSLLLPSQEPPVLMDNNPAYNPVIFLASEELPSSDVAGTDTYEAVDQRSELVNIVPNPSYQQQRKGDTLIDEREGYEEVKVSHGSSKKGYVSRTPCYDYVSSTPCYPKPKGKRDRAEDISLASNPSYSSAKAAAVDHSLEISTEDNPAYSHQPAKDAPNPKRLITVPGGADSKSVSVHGFTMQDIQSPQAAFDCNPEHEYI